MIYPTPYTLPHAPTSTDHPDAWRRGFRDGIIDKLINVTDRDQFDRDDDQLDDYAIGYRAGNRYPVRDAILRLTQR